MQDELLYQVGLQLIPGIGNGNAKHLISYRNGARNVFQSTKSQLTKIPGIGTKTIQELMQQNVLREAEAILNNCHRADVEILHFTSRSYPSRLKTLFDAPNILYKTGDVDLNMARSVSIVGTRRATAYGKSMTQNIVLDLKSNQVTTVSGLAYGIDIEAHRASMENNIPTIAVIAGGLDRIYPSQHKKYVDQIKSNGCLLSEHPPGTKPEAHLFPARNRIIAGMGDTTIVVEAGTKGGALITAHLADSYDRPVFAVPGNLNNPFSEGCNRLIRNQKSLNLYGCQGPVLLSQLGYQN